MGGKEGSMGWTARFELSWEINEDSVNDVPGITSEVRISDSGSVFLKGFNLQIPPSSKEEAVIIALEKSNRISDYLSSIHRLPVEAYLLSITEIGSAGEAKAGYAELKTGAAIHKSVNLDWADIKKVIESGDTKLLRQLAHYRAGLRYSQDPINQLREFYLVLEDEYGKDHPSLVPYRYVRNALCHPELSVGNQIKKLLNDIGETSIDPSSQAALDLVKMKVEPLKKEAEFVVAKIIKSLS